ncbi:MAG: CHAT domain-containing protein [Chloroflexi bacterium]|nr:CHAT domain-containing protein [Chloroflexota bacterium]
MCKILVVDDCPDFRKTLAGLLTDAGYAVQTAKNEGEALAAFMEDAFDFAVIDVRLHGDDEEDESGLSLAMAVRRLDEKVRIILITGYRIKSQQVVRAARYYGATDFIEKGQDVGKLTLETIEKARKESKRPEFGRTGDETKLSLSLTAGQPLFLRAYGRHVRSTRTWTVLRVDTERYARRTELARKDVADMRFQIEEIGNKLWNEIFIEHQEAAEVYFEARGKSKPLSLLFETPREFLRLPLEFMRSQTPSEYLVLQHPFARFIHNAIPRHEVLSPSRLAKTKKLRVLLIASNTEPPIPGADVEVQEIHKFLNDQKAISVEVMPLPTEQATYDRVQNELKKSKYDIIHYAGHGFFDAFSPEESFLCFWNGENRGEPIKRMIATELKLLLDQSQARLVYLSSCYGTATDGKAALLDDDFLGLADAVVQAGVPSVLGFRWPVSDDRAHTLALAFYQSLLEQGSPEVALWHARRELAAVDRNDPTWLSPILIHQE